MFPKSKKLLSAIPLLSVALSIDANATQVIQDCYRAHQEVNISSREQNRLAFDGRRIGNVVPSQKGAITYVKDEAAGALYFTMASDTPNMGTVTLFVTDEQNPSLTCKLILVPRPIAGEEIIIKPPPEGRKSAAGIRGGDGRALAYQRHAKDMILQMADEENVDVDAVQINQEIPLWKEARLVLLSKYLDQDLVGEKYRLTNVSDKDMLLVEQELYRKGVVAVVIENHTLPAKGQTMIFIVRGRKDNE
jgi:conjugal transfer pilus assembly protein TraK